MCRHVYVSWLVPKCCHGIFELCEKDSDWLECQNTLWKVLNGARAILNCLQIASPRCTFGSEMNQTVRWHLGVSTPDGNCALLIQDVMVTGSVYCQLRVYLVDELSSLSPRHASRRQWPGFRREGLGSIATWTLLCTELHWNRFFSQYVGFPLSVVPVHLNTTVVRMTNVGTFKQITLFRISENIEYRSAVALVLIWKL